MTLCNCGLTRNLILNFHRTTHLVMEVTIGHTYSMQHDFKPNTFAGITTCLYGITFNLTCSPQYTKWFEQLQHNWSPIIPKFDMDLVSSPRTSQSSQFSNSMCSPTTDVASTQSSQLAHPSSSLNRMRSGKKASKLERKLLKCLMEENSVFNVRHNNNNA